MVSDSTITLLILTLLGLKMADGKMAAVVKNGR
jgi:hypothetical protein